MRVADSVATGKVCNTGPAATDSTGWRREPARKVEQIHGAQTLRPKRQFSFPLVL
jgi:hypothetical protein